MLLPPGCGFFKNFILLVVFHELLAVAWLGMSGANLLWAPQRVKQVKCCYSLGHLTPMLFVSIIRQVILSIDDTNLSQPHIPQG